MLLLFTLTAGEITPCVSPSGPCWFSSPAGGVLRHRPTCHILQRLINKVTERHRRRRLRSPSWRDELITASVGNSGGGGSGPSSNTNRHIYTPARPCTQTAGTHPSTGARINTPPCTAGTYVSSASPAMSLPCGCIWRHQWRPS